MAKKKVAKPAAVKKILTKEIAENWVDNWEPEWEWDVLYETDGMDDCTSISDDAAAVFAGFDFKSL